jgi:PAS domain S-box-containing protein
MTKAVRPSRHLARKLNLGSFSRTRLRGTAAYAFTLAATGLACVLSLTAAPGIYQTPFLIVSAAVVAVIWFAEFRQCLLAIAVSALFVNYYLLPPQAHWSLGRGELARTGFWFLVAAGLSLLVSRLRIAEGKASRIVASIAEGFFIVDREWRLVYANNTVVKFIGKPRTGIIGQTLWEVVPEIQGGPVEQRLRWCAHTNLPVDFETHSRQRRKWAHVRAYPFAGGVSIFIQDVTGAKRKEAELRSAVDRLSTAYKAAHLGVWEWNIQTGELFWSDEVPRIHGIPVEEFDGRLECWIKTVHPEDAADLRGKIREALVKRQDYDFEFRVIGPDGEIRWLSDRGTVILDAQGRPERMCGVTADITERRLEEESLRRSEKLATAGRIVATISHELNNPLAAVTNLLYLARQDKGVTAETQALLRMADEQLARVNHLARQTLGFYRDNSRPQALDVSRLMEELLAIFNDRLATKQIRVEKEFESSSAVFALKGELQQLFSNLLTNAIDASPQGGALILRSKVELLLGTHPAYQVRIQVEDFGAGIPPGDVPKIFEPFFTTKSTVGTGLGLWLSKQIVEKNGGRIEFRTRCGSGGTGTCFSVILPASPGPLLQPQEPFQPPAPPESREQAPAHF